MDGEKRKSRKERKKGRGEEREEEEEEGRVGGIKERQKEGKSQDNRKESLVYKIKENPTRLKEEKGEG